MRATILIATMLVATATVVRPAAAQSELYEWLETLEEDDAGVDMDRLQDLIDQPINLNTATMEELLLIPMITRAMAAAVLEARRDRGGFSSHAELENVAELDERGIAWITLFTMVPDPGKAGATTRAPTSVLVRTRFTRRLDVGKGYDSDARQRTYLGGPSRHYQRIRLRTGDFEGNLTLDKQPGEPYQWHPSSRRFGFDFASGYLRYSRTSGILRRVIAGDYSVGAGYGLGMGSAMFAGKGRETVRGIAREAGGVREIGSTLRSAHHRGIAASLLLPGDVRLDVYASRRHRDATIDTLLIDDEQIVRSRSIASADLHRTAGERARHRALRERLAGASATVAVRGMRLGVTAHRVTLDPPLLPAARDDLLLLPERSHRSVATVHATLPLSRMTAFGEHARTDAGASASFAGIAVGEHGIEGKILYRRYAVAFDNHFAAAFGHQSGGNRNETGVYVGVRAALSRTVLLRAYVDQVTFPWLRFGRHVPTSLQEWLVDVEYRPRRWTTTSLTLRSRTEEASTSASIGAPVQQVYDARRTGLRIHQKLMASSAWEFNLRGEFAWSESTGETSTGALLLQDILWNVAPKLQFAARHMIFDTREPVRLYSYERDLSGAFGMISVGGRGRRSYVMTAWRPTPRHNLQVKYGVTTYLDVESVGSGNDEVSGNRIREVRLQLDTRF